MRIGIVANDSGQAAALVREMAHLNLLWVAGEGNGQLDYPVYEDYSQALTEAPVDLIVVGTGRPGQEAMVVPAAAASLLGAQARPEVSPALPSPTRDN